jgi:hypothetical protein
MYIQIQICFLLLAHVLWTWDTVLHQEMKYIIAAY